MRKPARGFRRAVRGAVMAEYALCLLVAIPMILGMFAGGEKMLVNYRLMRTNILRPGP